ncbi:MAG: PolC-type DNA polymerase III [Ilumatobacter sp.]
MALPRFAVVDVETSGLKSHRHRLLQVAMVSVDAAGRVDEEWETFVRLRWPLSSVGPTHVHGITRSDLRGAPPAAEVVDELCGRLGDRLLVAHNARFDGEFLRRAAGSRLEPEHAARLERRLCTLRMSRRLDPDRSRSHRLGDLCDRYGVALDRPHEALADARATAAILPHLLNEHAITEASQLEPFLDRPGLDARRRWPRRRSPQR